MWSWPSWLHEPTLSIRKWLASLGQTYQAYQEEFSVRCTVEVSKVTRFQPSNSNLETSMLPCRFLSELNWSMEHVTSIIQVYFSQSTEYYNYSYWRLLTPERFAGMTWSFIKFPLLSVIPLTLKIIQEDEAKGICALPNSSTHALFI